jgi:hypothetical protein
MLATQYLRTPTVLSDIRITTACLDQGSPGVSFAYTTYDNVLEWTWQYADGVLTTPSQTRLLNYKEVICMCRGGFSSDLCPVKYLSLHSNSASSLQSTDYQSVYIKHNDRCLKQFFMPDSPLFFAPLAQIAES